MKNWARGFITGHSPTQTSLTSPAHLVDMMKGRGLGGVGDEGAAAARVAQVLISAMRREKIALVLALLSMKY